MRHFPVFMNVQNRRILVTGAGETAIAKLRLLLKTEAQVVVFAIEVEQQVQSWADAGLLQIIHRDIRMDDFYNAAFIYAAEDDPERDATTAAKAKMANVMFNIVDNLADSEFITPAIVDRDPVTIAIGTEGTAPILARKIKSEIEENLPSEVGLLAKLAEYFRPKASRLPAGRPRRNFWSKYFYEAGPRALKEGGNRAIGRTLNALFEEANVQEDEEGRVALVGAGPGDPDLLTRKALKLIHEADVVIHDRLVSKQILELARREADIIETGKKGFGLSWKQDQAGVEWEIIPGITTASAAAANLGTSLTKRGRNSALQILTAQDVKGFAEQDWRNVAKEGSVAAIYMGLKSARFLSGRLLMHGANPNAPITIIENVSRPNQRIIPTSVGELSNLAETLELDGPAILMLGLEPRQAAEALKTNEEKLAQTGTL